MKPDTQRAAHKKLLLLKGTLHRLEILQAQASLRSATVDSVVGQRLPGLLAFLSQHKVGAMLTTLLPLLAGARKLSRLVRRATFLLSAGAALAGLLRSASRGRAAKAEQAGETDKAATPAREEDKKNPGPDRD